VDGLAVRHRVDLLRRRLAAVVLRSRRAGGDGGHVLRGIDLLHVGGSICFLVASWLAYSEVNRGVWPRSDGSIGWRIAALNLAGSLAFGLAAIAARYLPTTGEPANIALVNAGTFLGGVCFLVGAVLLPVESARDRDASVAPAG
jgi:hypothetical protein